MKGILLKFATLALCAALCIPGASAENNDRDMVQVGLAFGSSALSAAKLQNSDGFGAGYRFGYFDDDLEFEELAYTDEDVNAITMLRTSQIYRSGSNYTTSKPNGTYDTIGCFHVVLNEFRTYEDALDLADTYENGFVAWINGTYQAREGTYATKEEAQNAAQSLGGVDVKGTSAFAVNVVETGTSKILFQFDGLDKLALGVMPDVTGEEDVYTWFKGYQYRGGFRYERVSCEDLNVVNIVDVETYTKGVIPYEMTNSWPMEALKAQAVCARSYAYNCMKERSHASYNVDICTTECCQVYRGVGSGNSNYQANERTDRAVEESEGMYALYKGTPIVAYYSSSHGGASERIDRVQNSSFSKYPYICGVIDPYEKGLNDRNPYSSWKKTYTASELTARLREKGYASGTSVDSIDLTYSEFGNVIKAKVNYTNGKSNTFTPRNDWGVRSLFGVSSLHFTVNGKGGLVQEQGGIEQEGSAEKQPVLVNENQNLDMDSSLYVLSGKGQSARIDPKEIFVITGTGTVSRLIDEEEQKPSTVPSASETVVTVSGSKYIVEGAGNGHQMGMSQFGAYAMAEEGFDYDQIVEFYYPGVEVEPFSLYEE